MKKNQIVRLVTLFIRLLINKQVLLWCNNIYRPLLFNITLVWMEFANDTSSIIFWRSIIQFFLLYCQKAISKVCMLCMCIFYEKLCSSIKPKSLQLDEAGESFTKLSKKSCIKDHTLAFYTTIWKRKIWQHFSTIFWLEVFNILWANVNITIPNV